MMISSPEEFQRGLAFFQALRDRPDWEKFKDETFVYCPYIPLTSSGVMVDPDTLKPVEFQTRYGIIPPPDDAPD